MRLRTSRIFIALLCAAPAIASAGGTLVLVSEPGEFIGRGRTQTLPFADGEVHMERYGTDFVVHNAAAWWDLEFTGVVKNQLSTGCYERAQRSPFAEAGRPGLQFNSNGLGCNTVVGRFQILEVATDANGLPTVLALDFVQHCDGQGPALFGKLRYNSSIPADAQTIPPVFVTHGTLDYASAPGDVIGGGHTRSYQFNRPMFTASGNGQGGAISMDFTNLVYRGGGRWALDLGTADQSPLSIGTYTDAQSFASPGSGHPELNFAVNGLSCTTALGDFSITQIDYDRIDGLPTALSASFNQQCAHASAGLHAQIDFVTTFRNGLADDVIFGGNFETIRSWPLYSPTCQ